MINQYKNILNKSLTLVTGIFLLRNDEVLLGYKKRGLGKGKYVGIGGKVEKKETVEEAAIREFFEETGIRVLRSDLQEVATIRFYFPHIPDESWNLEERAFLVEKYQGEPVETDEIRPVWFKKENFPFDQMWDDAKYWIPRALKEDYIEEEFLYSDQMEVVDYLIVR